MRGEGLLRQKPLPSRFTPKTILGTIVDKDYLVTSSISDSLILGYFLEPEPSLSSS